MIRSNDSIDKFTMFYAGKITFTLSKNVSQIFSPQVKKWSRKSKLGRQIHLPYVIKVTGCCPPHLIFFWALRWKTDYPRNWRWPESMIVEDMMHSFYRLSNVFWYCPLGDLIQEACSASVLPNAYHFLKALQERVYQTKISSQPVWIFNLSHDWSGGDAIKSEDC